MKWQQKISSPFSHVSWLWVFAMVLTTYRPCVAADTLLVATAANFIRPMQELAELFTREKAGKVTITYGSSGKLFAQLKHRAPYDLFLSADKQRPELLYEQGICEAPFLYAVGSVVLWSAEQSVKAESWQEALNSETGKIAIASPQGAPYGKKAFQVLEQEKLDRKLQIRLVFGQSVGQVFLFTKTGGAKFGFIALSQALSPEGRQGQYWLIPEAESVQQWGCVVAASHNHALSNRLRAFLAAEESRALLHEYGYQ